MFCLNIKFILQTVCKKTARYIFAEAHAWSQKIKWPVTSQHCMNLICFTRRQWEWECWIREPLTSTSYVAGIDRTCVDWYYNTTGNPTGHCRRYKINTQDDPDTNSKLACSVNQKSKTPTTGIYSSACMHLYTYRTPAPSKAPPTRITKAGESCTMPAPVQRPSGRWHARASSPRQQ